MLLVLGVAVMTRKRYWAPLVSPCTVWVVSRTPLTSTTHCVVPSTCICTT